MKDIKIDQEALKNTNVIGGDHFAITPTTLFRSIEP